MVGMFNRHIFFSFFEDHSHLTLLTFAYIFTYDKNVKKINNDNK